MGRGPTFLPLKTLWSLPPVWFIHPQWTPPYPQLPLSPLAWPPSILSFIPLHLQLKALFVLLDTPLPHKPLPLVKALLQSLYQCKCSAIVLFLDSLCSLSPWPHWHLLAPLAPLSLFLCWLPLLWRAPLYRPSHCWAELSCASCIITHVQCGWTGRVQYSVTRATFLLVLSPSNHRTATAICPADDGTQHCVMSTVVPQPWPVVSSSELVWTGPSWTFPEGPPWSQESWTDLKLWFFFDESKFLCKPSTAG